MKSRMNVSTRLVFTVLCIGLQDTGSASSVCKNRNVPSLSTPRRNLLGHDEFRRDRNTPVTCRNAPSPPTTCLFPFADGDKIYDNCTGWENGKNFYCSFDLTAKQHFSEVAPCNPADDITSLVEGPLHMPRFFALRGTHLIYAFMTQVLKLKCPAEQKITMLKPELGELECVDGECKPRRGPENNYIRRRCVYNADKCCDHIWTEMAPQCNNRNSCNFIITSESCLKNYGYIVLEYFCTEKQNCVELVGAASWGNQTAVEHYLHAQQCDVNSRDSYLRTPLHYAAVYNRIEVAKTLLSRGADRLLVDSWYQTPLARALFWNSVDVSLLLLKSCDPNITWWQTVYQSDVYNVRGPASMWYEGKNETLKTALKNTMYRDHQRLSMLRSRQMEVQRSEWSVWGSCVTRGDGAQYRTKSCALVDLRRGRHVLIADNFIDSRPCESTPRSTLERAPIFTTATTPRSSLERAPNFTTVTVAILAITSFSFACAWVSYFIIICKK